MMGRQKKNELDVILEQLKKSYAADSEDALDEKSDGAEGSEEDVELSYVLERIFSEADNTVACENGAETHDEERADKTLTEINIDESPENDMESTVITDKSDSERNEIICESEVIKEAPSSVEASVVQEDIGTDNDLYTEGIDAECQEESAAPDDACAGESVDAVFKAMFPQMYSSDDKDKNKSDHDDTDDHHTDLEREVEKELDSKEKSSDSPMVVTISEQPESQEDVIEIEGESSATNTSEQEVKEVKIITVAESVQVDVSLNEKLQKEDNSIGNIISSQKIEDLKQAISIGDRFRFQRELFGGNGEIMNKTITELNNATSLEKALEFISTNFSWNEKDDNVKDFLSLLERKFIN
jgi:hypothetical protein